jgi:hypothetical protein
MTRHYETYRTRFGELFAGRTTKDRPAGVRGVNFVTETLIGHVEGPDGKPVEVTTGVFLGRRVFGVTFPRVWGGAPDERDKMCESLEEVYEAIFGSNHTCRNCEKPIEAEGYCSATCEGMDKHPAPRDDMEKFTS